MFLKMIQDNLIEKGRKVSKVTWHSVQQGQAKW